MAEKVRKKRHLTSSQIIILGFLGVILTGSFLLMMPLSSRSGEFTPFLDSLFTATSATCVTGLVTRDTATYWSQFGQFIILILIQIGGMGVVTVAVAIATISGRKIGLSQRSTMQEAISAPKVGGIVRLTGFIIRGSLLIEAIGAVIMFSTFYKDFGFFRGLWYSIFHSISAFCNAGFDLMGIKTPFSSLTSYSGHVVINITIMLLIVVGGIGFMTWDDVVTKRHRFKLYRLQSKIVLTMTVFMILFPAIYFYFGEFSGAKWGALSHGEKVLSSLFQSVTLRTAGFNTVDLGAMSEAGQMIMIIWMLIGGAPGSTAGGMKIVTVSVLGLTTLAVFRRKEAAQCFGRRLEADAIRSATTILMMYLVLFLTGGIIMSVVEGLPILTCLFETASAIGTVGLTLGITTQLSVVSKIILILLMFLGRVGGLTLIFATVSGMRPNVSKLPQEKVTVG